MTVHMLIAAVTELKDVLASKLLQNQCSMNTALSLLWAYKDEGIVLRDLSTKLSMSSAAITGIAKVLEECDLAERISLLGDQRLKMLVCRPEGATLVLAALEASYKAWEHTAGKPFEETISGTPAQTNGQE